MGRPNNTKELIITLTDGINNRPSTNTQANLTASIQLIRNREISHGLTSMAIGVGGGYTDSDLEAIATDVTGYQTLIKVDDFAALQTAVP